MPLTLRRALRRLWPAALVSLALASVMPRLRRGRQPAAPGVDGPDGLPGKPDSSEPAGDGSAPGPSRGPGVERSGTPGEGDKQLPLTLPARDFDGERPKLLRQLRRFFLGEELVLTPSHIGRIEDPPGSGSAARTRIGICCSGGGIRSAAFNLGALQRLQAKEVLPKADYLAAVSGGSYIAAAFSMVAKTGEPDTDDSDPGLMDAEHPAFGRGSPEEQYLRNRCSYMAPGGGGMLRLVLRVALGLAINLVLVAAAMLLVGWALAKGYEWLYPGLEKAPPKASAHVGLSWWLIPSALAAVGLALGLIGMFLSPHKDRLSKGFEAISLWLLGAAALVLAIDKGLPELIAYLRNHEVASTTGQLAGSPHIVAPAAGGSFAALLATVFAALRSKAAEVEAEVKKFRSLSARVQRVAVRVVVWLAGPVVLTALLLLWTMLFISDGIPWYVVVAVAAAGIVAVAFADVTTWSLHPFYKRRLSTAFSLKRVRRDAKDPVPHKAKAEERKYDEQVELTRSRLAATETDPGPTLLVCAAANISDAGLTPPGRAVTSFTFSSGSIGGPLVGGISTEEYEGLIAKRHLDKYSLLAAVAMSGAAISPSMGKETRPSFRFLMCLANVRLGVWVPNPRRMRRWERGDRAQKLADQGRKMLRAKPAVVERDSRQRSSRRRLFFPRPGLQYLIKEMLGWNSVYDRYLYVTDGGHYDNLGLVELLRRGCTEIYCFDAGGGKPFASLGDAIALARSELEVEITNFRTVSADEARPGQDAEPGQDAKAAQDGNAGAAAEPAQTSKAGEEPTGLECLEEDAKTRIAKHGCAIADIAYPPSDDHPGTKIRGTLVYVRSVVPQSAPEDVQAFRVNDEAFPHHSTVDQLYTDQKFEAYRELGAHVCEEALRMHERIPSMAAVP